MYLVGLVCWLEVEPAWVEVDDVEVEETDDYSVVVVVVVVVAVV